MAKKNVLICIPSYTFGGAETHSRYTALSIKKDSNYEVFFLAFGRNDGFEIILQNDGFKTLHYKIKPLDTINSLQKILEVFKLFLFLRAYQFKYIFSGTKNENLLMGLIWKILGVKKFYWHQWGIDKNKNIGFIEKMVIKLKPNYVANSQACLENISTRHNIKNKSSIQIIHNTFKSELLSIEKKETSKIFTILMIANFFPEKDHKTLLRAIKIFETKYPDAEIKLEFLGVAPGNSIAKDESKALAFDLNINTPIHFKGKTDNIIPFLKQADIGILSTSSEGFSNSILEYMAAGIAVIATEIPSNLEALGENNKEWLFPVGDEKKCFELIEKLYLNQNLRIELGKNNRKYAQANYTFENYSKKILDLLID